MVTPCPEGSLIAVHAQPRAGRSKVVGPHGDALKVRLAAPPVEGAANKELLKLLSKVLGVSRSRLALVAGDSSRRKRIRVEGMEPGEVLTRLGLPSASP